MASSEYLFIHPWFQPDENWAGFHLEFAGSDQAFADVLARLSRHPALLAMDHRLLWFVPALTPESVAGALALPVRQVVLLVPPSAATSSRESADMLEADLRRRGAKLGKVLSPTDSLPAAGAWDYVVLSAGHARTLPPHSLLGLTAKTAVVVTGLRSRNDFAWAVANHCALVTGEYLLNRSAPCNKPDMLRVRLLRLLALIAADADTCEIEEVFRHEPKLAYGLLRLVNSAAMAPRSPITSFAQAITILGRQQLQRWLQLLVYANPNDGQHPNPLLLQAATRGRLMEALAPHIRPAPEGDAPSDAAFMIGTFSLLDVLLNLSMPEILQQLPLPRVVQAALEERRGPLGTLLAALSAADNRDSATASRLLDGLGVGDDTFASAQLSALEWASTIRIPTP